MKDVTGYIAKNKGKFFVDREDLDSGDEVVAPGDKIKFSHKGTSYKGVVSDRSSGRDDDVYEVDLT